MNHFTQPQLFISAKAKNLGIQLIKDLQISMAADLVLFLDVNPCFNGHQAVMIWVHHCLDLNSDLEYHDIRKNFIGCFPESF